MDRKTLRVPDPTSPLPGAERRRSVRHKLRTPIYVSFNGPESGMVVDLNELLDVHENGFAVQTAIPTGLQANRRLEVNCAVTLCLDLPETGKYVHGSGQVMWADDAGRAGICFSFLPEDSRKILKEWLFANLLIASVNHAARAEQLARRQQAELPAPAPTPIPILAKPSAPDEPDDELIHRAQLLSSLDDVRGEIQNIEVRHIHSHDLGANAGTDAILHLIAERAMSLTGASGAALALRNDGRMVCRASVGDPAPPLGSEVDVSAGLSGECLRSGLLVNCEDPETDPRVDPEVCRALGIGSFMAVPIFADFRVDGLLEILSPYPRSFSKVQGTILERLVELVPQIERKKFQAQTLEEKSIEETKAEQKTSGRKAIDLTSVEPNTIEQETENEIEQRKTDAKNIEAGKLEAGRLESPPRLKEFHPKQSAEIPQPDLKNLEEVHARAGRSRFVQIGLFVLVLGTVAVVMGYLLAPTIERHWMGTRSSQQSSAKSASSVSLQEAANRGDADAQYQLGILYHNGEGVPKDDVQAVLWFQLAAEQGYVPAQSTLGAYYWAGRGVQVDLVKAYFWSQLALAQGDDHSKARLEGLSAQMTPSDVAKARQLAEDWLRSHIQRSKPNPGSN